MKKITNIAHPLKNRSGLSQRTRINHALAFDAALIDGKTLADRLIIISKYSRFVNFYEVSNSIREGDFQNMSDWSSFFKESLPFQLALLSKTNIDELEKDFYLLLNELKAHPSEQSLSSLFEFMYSKFLHPAHKLYQTVALEKNSFKDALLGIIKSSFIDPLTSFVCLYNTSVNFLCIKKRNFSDFIKVPWQLKVDEVYAINTCFIYVKKDKKEAFQKMGEALEGHFYQFLSGLDIVISSVPDYISESLIPLEDGLKEKHQPHLALLFTFLELFKHFQGNINGLGKEHLDFFYQQVLKMEPKAAEPDKAHIIFELAKHLQVYPLKKDLLLKDGKDKNKQDIQFGLDHELVLDHAKITDLRTLSLFPFTDNKEFLEGVYIAPVANSLDGKGKEFKENQPSNWPSLGSKYSKLKLENEKKYIEHPPARLGFVLASPVLLLQEGKRTIKIVINCNFESADTCFEDLDNKLIEAQIENFYLLKNDLIDLHQEQLSNTAKKYLSNLFLHKKLHKIPKNELGKFYEMVEPISCENYFTSEDVEIIDSYIEINEALKTNNTPLFKVLFSGEEKWIETSPTININQPPDNTLLSGGKIQFELEIILDSDVPAVTFFNEEKLKEKIDLKEIQPLVKIELNEDIKVECDNPEKDASDCCLKKTDLPSSKLLVSPYQLLKKLVLVNASIDVEVCGVKNLIVQNDEGALDLNSQLFPFGLRPEVPGFDPMNQLLLGTPPDPLNPIGALSFLGPSFYLGSKEVFYKKWSAVRVNIEWKEKPDSFHDYYKAYIKHNKDLSGPPLESNFGLKEEDFKLKINQLKRGNWVDISEIELFSKTTTNFNNFSCDKTLFGWEIVNNNIGPIIHYSQPLDFYKNSRDGFLKFTLAGQDFLHKEYPFVLGRQMLAYGMVNEGKKLTDAIYHDTGNKTVISAVLDYLGGTAETMGDRLDDAIEAADDVKDGVENLANFLNTNGNNLLDNADLIRNQIEVVKDFIQTNMIGFGNDLANLTDLADLASLVGGYLSNRAQLTTMNNSTDASAIITINVITTFLNNAIGRVTGANGLEDLVQITLDALDQLDTAITDSNIFKFLSNDALQALIPNEPWTPIIKNIYVDYTASAAIGDMELIHLYPFENTSKHEDIEAPETTLFPIFNNQGTLFIGIEKLTLGGNLSILFQLAEATADSEQDRAGIDWHYLSDNTWIKLQTDFDVISDATDGLTVSGIVNIAVPDTIFIKDNTVMPNSHYWIKVSAANNVKAIAEIIGVHSQAAKTSARFNELHDKSRLDKVLNPGSIAKLVESDFSVKKLTQTYPSFEGRLPEADGHFYTRVSEYLKHKGRSLMLTDYEKIVLEGFPEIYKVKCISHSMGLSANEYHRDLEIAPGFLIVAVIPDLTKLLSGNLQEPKMPVSLLEKIAEYIKKRTSPFARLKVMNPRFEYVDVNISVRLYRGKSSNFYQKKLEEDIRLFLAPWFLGDSEKLAFGQVVLFSDLVGFVERMDYVDFIDNIELSGTCEQTGDLIKPLTARSILTGGTICVTINKEDCIEVAGIGSVLTEDPIN